MRAPRPSDLLALLLVASTSCRAVGSADASALRVVELRCDDLREPLAIPSLEPRLSWRVETTRPERRGQAWTAFQLQVARAPEDLAGGPHLWDSGWVPSSSPVSAIYAGAPLASRARAAWRVRVRDLDGNVSPWSRAARFAVGLVSARDWTGAWIGARDAGGEDRTRAPWLRRRFELSAPARRAVLHVASIGYHEVHVNGVRIGDALLAPSVSDLSERTQAASYDVTAALLSGDNVLGLWLGPGWSRYPRYGVPAGPLARAELDVTLESGAVLRIATGSDWVTRPSHVEAIGGWDFGDYGGERVDAGRALPRWSAPDLDDSDWEPARVFESALAVVPESVESNRAVVELRPTSIEEPRTGVFRVDMGRTFAGVVEARLSGAPGATVQLSFSEREDQDLTYAQKSELVLGPDGTGTFQHRFNYVTARWITIEGASEAPGADDVRASLVRSGYARAGAFTCSDPLLQRVHDTVAWTFECLSLGGYVVDCAHRERWGYGGDAHATMETALSLYDLGAFYRDWLDDWAAIQDEHGNLPFTCPTYRGGGGPAWSGIVVMLPWEVFRRTGDRRVLERAWPTIERWLAFLEANTADDLLRFYFDERYTRDVYSFLGDWVPPGDEQVGGLPDEKRRFFNNAYRVWVVRTAARIAEGTGRNAEARALRERAGELAEAVHARFFDPERGVHVEARQTYYALPVLAGIGPEDVREDLFQRLLADVEERAHVDTGIHGTWLLVKLLLERRRADLLHLVASQTDQPSWGHMLAEGATTIWEQWNGVHSRTHSSFLSIGAFFYEGLLGIRPLDEGPGYARFELAPAIGVGELAHASGHLDTVRGRISCEWSVENERAELSIVVPPGTTAVVRIPTSAPRGVQEGGVPAGRASGIASIAEADAGLTCEVLPGSYRFTFSL
jgi:alpha-L-rhamnosidase